MSQQQASVVTTVVEVGFVAPCHPRGVPPLSGKCQCRVFAGWLISYGAANNENESQ